MRRLEESHYVGVRCGIMDQMASSLADATHMVFLDTRTLERRRLPFPAHSEIVVLDSGMPRGERARPRGSGGRRRRAVRSTDERVAHASLRDDFEGSVAALDVLVDILQTHSQVYGARLTGAGFGGACVALVRAGSAARVKTDALRVFAARGYRGAALV